MDYELNEDQDALLNGLQAVLRPYDDVPLAKRRGFSCYLPEMQLRLREAGFIDVIAQGFTPLEAALVVLECAQSPCVVETANSGLVWPSVLDTTPTGPVALIEGNGRKASRFLAVAKHALVDTGSDLMLLDLSPEDVEPVETVLAYPYGKLVDPSIIGRGRSLGAEARQTARRWARVALALEFAGAAGRATAFTVEYVKQRHAFGRAIGSFQAVQHRLAQCHQIAQGMRYTALYAASTGDAVSADVAANYAQRHAGKFAFDLHQFNGGMGVTNEHLLHLWTHRIRALQGELGGANGAALSLADQLWPVSDSRAA